jgi:hypothetical protein
VIHIIFSDIETPRSDVTTLNSDLSDNDNDTHLISHSLTDDTTSPRDESGFYDIDADSFIFQEEPFNDSVFDMDTEILKETSPDAEGEQLVNAKCKSYR